MRIALGHQARVGKDTFAEIMGTQVPVVTFAFATILKQMASEIQSTLGKVVEKDPTLLQNLASALRKTYGDDLFARHLEDILIEFIHSNPDSHIVITDMREISEMEMLKKLGFRTVKITRINRPIDRDPNHPSETALLNATFDFTIANDGTIEQFHEQVKNVLEVIGAL